MAMDRKGFVSEDERLRKSDAAASRGDRDTADTDREFHDGLALTAEERRRLLRNQGVREVLPSPPEMPGWHFCWLSTTNSTDPIYKRMQLGYVPVKATELPGFESFTVTGGNYDGGIMCNEMVLFKIPQERYQDIMTLYHYDMPLEEEGMLKQSVERDDEDREGNKLAITEGFERLGKAGKTPVFS